MSDYWDEELNTDEGYSAPSAPVADPWAAPTEDGGYESAPGGNAGYDISDADIQDSLAVAFGAEIPKWAGISAPAVEYAKRQGVGEGAQPKQEEKGLIGRITDFANQNKSLTEMVLKGVAGAATAKNASKAATAQMREKDQIERERNAQYSASIAALAKPGIIGKAQSLKRTNGAAVFNNGRIA